MIHFPSFLVGSLVSGTAFLLVNQQLSYRERLTYKWPLAEYVETQFRNQFQSQWKSFAALEQAKFRQQLGGVDLFSREGITKQWNQMMDDAQNYFAKKD
jgi:hypothetical protein